MLHVAMWGLQADIATVKKLLEHRQRCKTNGTLDTCLLCARSTCVRCVCCDCPPCGCLTRRLAMWRCVQPGVSAPSASLSPGPGNVRRRHGVSCVAVQLCGCVAVWLRLCVFVAIGLRLLMWLWLWLWLWLRVWVSGCVVVGRHQPGF